MDSPQGRSGAAADPSKRFDKIMMTCGTAVEKIRIGAETQALVLVGSGASHPRHQR